MSAVLKRKVFFIRIQLLSPLNVSSGEDEWTDADVLRDGKGNPFVAGTSPCRSNESIPGKREK